MTGLGLVCVVTSAATVEVTIQLLLGRAGRRAFHLYPNKLLEQTDILFHFGSSLPTPLFLETHPLPPNEERGIYLGPG